MARRLFAVLVVLAAFPMNAAADQLVAASCAAHIPLHRTPANARVVRREHRVARPRYLQRGDRVTVSAPGHFSFSYHGNRFSFPHAHLLIGCRRIRLGERKHPLVLGVVLESGRVRVSSVRRAIVFTPELVVRASRSRTVYVVSRNPVAPRSRAWTLDQPIVATRASDQALGITTRATYTAISDRRGIRLDIWPFAFSRAQRRPTAADGLVPFWADGRPCSVGCSPTGVTPGWPIQPFHRQHAIRAGLNELRPANFHIGVDVEARNSQPVYPIQSGVVRLFGVGTPDEHAQVGQFQYWHIDHTVSSGQYASAYRTELGTVKYGFKHVHVSEIGPSGQYLNPLRPGRSLGPYTDTEPPVIGEPQVFADGRVIVGVFDPQSFVQRGSYETPVLAPAAIAWRLFDLHGHPRTGLEWALRGSQNYPPALKPVIFAPGARNPGFDCFAFHRLCIPNWVYWLAGGLAPPLPIAGLPRGRYRLAVYAWDWTGRSSALDDWFSVPLAHAAGAPTGPLAFRFDYQ